MTTIVFLDNVPVSSLICENRKIVDIQVILYIETKYISHNSACCEILDTERYHFCQSVIFTIEEVETQASSLMQLMDKPKHK